VNKKPVLLVVDDEVDITETYALYFALHGFEVIKANNGFEAVTVVAHRVPDLIISDCMMPTMDGVALSRHLKADPRLLRTPIILMSGAPERHDLRQGSYDLFLLKPVLLERLLGEIRRLLGAAAP
jgi:CheY-like chemotaxis protein